MSIEVTVGTLDEIPVGEGRTFAVADEQVAVYRMRDGSLRAIGAVCPHRGGPLADGLVDDELVVCPLHGRSFELATGVERGGDGPGVCAYRVTADGDGAIRIVVE